MQKCPIEVPKCANYCDSYHRHINDLLWQYMSQNNIDTLSHPLLTEQQTNFLRDMYLAEEYYSYGSV